MKLARLIAVTAILVILSYAYLYPGSQALLDGRTDLAMGDDTDSANLPYFYDQILRLKNEHPSWLLHGAVYLPVGDPERGIPYWISWNERIAVLIGSAFVTLEQLPTFVVALFMVLSGLAMYALGRVWGWSSPVSLGLGLAWAFCAYTRARAKVHNGFTGVFHLPLIFLALVLIVRRRDRKSLAIASFCLVAASSVSYYYILTTLFLSPFFLLFAALEPKSRREWRRVFGRLAVAVAPALMFLGLTFTFALPAGSRLDRAEALPKTGEAPGWKLHPFLEWYAAHPTDYLSSDLSLTKPGTDWNPLKESLNRTVLKNLGYGNAHERSNGIRWLILILALTAVTVFSLPRTRGWLQGEERRAVMFFAGLLAFAFWLSLPPTTFTPLLSPAYWLHNLFQQIRVPSRAGIVVHFSALMLAGLALAALLRKFPRVAGLSLLFPILVVAEYPPIQEMPMAKVRERIQTLQRSRGACGVGLYFPFVHADYTSLNLYHFQQRLRGSDCDYLNALADQKRSQYLWKNFPADMKFVEALPQKLVVQLQLARLVSCVPLSFIVFDPVVPADWAQKFCSELGWSLEADGSCAPADRGQKLKRYPDECGY